MIRFLIAFEVAWLAFFGWVWFAEIDDFGLFEPDANAFTMFTSDYYDALWMIALFVLLPICSAWVGAELVRAIRRPRFFDRRAHTPARWQFVPGFFSGAASILFVGLFITYGESLHVPDAFKVAIASLLSVILATVLLPRAKPGRCITCNYDTRNLPFSETPTARRCPECGTVIP